MKSNEEHIRPESEYYVCLPSAMAKSAFFYPVCVGRFFYEPGYRLCRNSYDSFLLMYVYSGTLTVEYADQKTTVSKGEFVLLNCYEPHAYYSATGWESIWCHFDGPVAGQYYQMIVQRSGNILRIPNPYSTISILEIIYDSCTSGANKKEPILSKLLTDLLTALLTSEDSTHGTKNTSADTIDESIAYINEHFTENISVSELAEKAMLSQYYFIRLFKKHTGYTPHEYILTLRLNTAKYLLQTSPASIKEICFRTGFSCESAFCSTFKKSTGKSPSQYRRTCT